MLENSLFVNVNSLMRIVGAIRYFKVPLEESFLAFIKRSPRAVPPSTDYAPELGLCKVGTSFGMVHLRL